MTQATMKKTRRCDCDLCRLSRVLQRILKRCTPAERRALDRLWERMAEAETLLDLRGMKR